jgi:hypothetical protein
VLDFVGCLAVQAAIAGVAVLVVWLSVERFGVSRGWTDRKMFWFSLPFLLPLIVVASSVSDRICSL